MLGASAAAAGVAAACGKPQLLVEPADEATTQSRVTTPSAPNTNRTLVVVELQGGADGLAMLQPNELGRVRDMRPHLVNPDAELIDAGAGFGWHPNLTGLIEHGLGAVVGIGSAKPSFSHFEMENRWWRGDSGQRSDVTTGIFGRMCDQLENGEPVTGISVSGGPTPGLTSEKAVTVGLVDPGASWFMSAENEWYSALRTAQRSMAVGSPKDSASIAAARSGLVRAERFGDALAELPNAENERYPWTDLGNQLRFAAEVMSVGAGVRIIHCRLGGFDTHTGQGWRFNELMADFNDAAAAFIGDLQQRGLWEDTLIMTTSEFGRRVTSDSGGTDHGGASTMLLCGHGVGGVHGVAPDLGALDDDNLVATARFEDYYATVANEWFGIDAAAVLPNGGDVIDGVLSA